MFDQIYDAPPEAWGNEEHRYLPLLYALMSIGSMFAKDENSRLSTEGYGSLTEQGYAHFVLPCPLTVQTSLSIIALESVLVSHRSSCSSSITFRVNASNTMETSFHFAFHHLPILARL